MACRELLVFSSALDKPPGFNFFVSKKQLLKKVNDIVWNILTFYLEDDDRRGVDFRRKTMTFVF